MPYLHQPEDLGDLLEGEPSYRVDQLRHWLYEMPVLSNTDMTNLPAGVRDKLEPLWPFEVEAEQFADGGTTRKWLFRAPDGAAIEAVLMGYPRRATLCISSQAGCALGCTFCATGQFGFERHLDAGEIMAQVAYAQAFPSPDRHAGHPRPFDQRRVHGDGRATRQLRPGPGSDPADDRGHGIVGEIDHRVDGRHGAGDPTTSRGALARVPRGQPPRRRRRAPEHASSRSTGVTPWRSSRRPPPPISRRRVVGSPSSGR